MIFYTHTNTHDINNFKCLFLVPSIALITQTLREWSEQAEAPINAICICSDSSVNRLNNSKEDGDGFNIKDIGFPASTNVNSIVRNFELIRNRKTFDLKNNIENGMTVVFSTYQSIDVISGAQKELNKKYNKEYDFDLIICDEAHRITGVILKSGVGKDESYFTKVHNNDFIIANKRIYITVTLRLYMTDAKKKAYEYVINDKSAIEWIMDRYQVTQDKNSGLTNDPNDWGREHGKLNYIFDLLLSVVEISVRMVDLVKEFSRIDVNFKK